MDRTNYKFCNFLLAMVSTIVLNNMIKISYRLLMKLEVINSRLSKDDWSIYFYLIIIVVFTIIDIIKMLINKPTGNLYIIIEDTKHKVYRFYVSLGIGIISLILLSNKFEQYLLFVAILSFVIALMTFATMKNQDGIYEDCICWHGRKILLTDILEVREHKKKVKILVKGKFMFIKNIQDYKLPLNKQDVLKAKNRIKAHK